MEKAWNSDQNTYLWETRQAGSDWETISGTLGKSVGACQAQYRRIRRRRKFAAQRRCAEAGHTKFGQANHCANTDCDNYHGLWS